MIKMQLGRFQSFKLHFIRFQNYSIMTKYILLVSTSMLMLLTKSMAQYGENASVTNVYFEHVGFTGDVRISFDLEGV